MPPQPEPISRTLWPRSTSSLAAICRFLASLSLLEAGIRMVEIGAGILPVAVEEEGVEPPVEVVMVRHVALGAARIVLGPAHHPVADPAQAAQGKFVELPMGVLEEKLEQVEHRALLDDEAAIHEQFAELQFRMEAQRHLGRGIREADRDPWFRSVTEGEALASGRGHLQSAVFHGPRERKIEKLLRQHGNNPRAVDLSAHRAEKGPGFR